ncbi:MAG: AzlD domain-containing protein [bacterium]|nr:AzlD domain-containing protein [bacterium]
MEKELILLTIVLMSAVTVLPRVLPVWILARRNLPRPVMIWLSYIPCTVLSALLLPELVVRQETVDFSFSNLYFWIAIPAFGVGLKTRNLFYAIITGIGGLALVRLLLN